MKQKTIKVRWLSPRPVRDTRGELLTSGMVGDMPADILDRCQPGECEAAETDPPKPKRRKAPKNTTESKPIESTEEI